MYGQAGILVSMKMLKAHWREIGLCFLILGNLLVWCVVARETRHGVLTVSFLDVGQGDSIFIEGPSGIQVLIDGGKGRAVLGQLGSVMPFYDHSIDVVLATHPDQDHMEGLIEVEKRYDTLLYMAPDLVTDKSFQTTLLGVVKERGVRELPAHAGQRIPLGNGAVLRILFPDQDVSGWQNDTNLASVVAKLEYGKTSFMFTGDSPIAVEDYLIGKLGESMNVDVLKAGHHGSRTSSAADYLAVVTPQIAVISAGKDNTYGHPHPEVIERLKAVGAEIKNTADVGRITITSDGNQIVSK